METITMMEILKALQEYIQDNFNNYISSGMQAIDIKNVVLKDVDTDKYTSKLMIHITFDGASFEELTTTSDSATLNPEVYIIHRGATKEKLFENIVSYTDSFMKMIRNDPTLDCVVDNCFISNVEYFDGVSADENIKAMKVTLSIEYEDNY